MKNNLNLIPRLAAVAIATGGLCYGDVAFGQATPAGAQGAQGPLEPTRVGSMAPTGAKPSKAELEKQNAAQAGATKPAAGAATTMAQLNPKDRAFIMEAAKDGMMEVEMGKMAVKQGKSAEVKQIGQMMVADHSKANQELMALAKAKGVKLGAPAKMAKMSDANFDSAYLDQMVKDHQNDIAAFTTAAKSGVDPDVKAWAAKMVPALKKHLQMVQAAQKKMPKAG